MVRSCHSRRRLARLFDVERLESRFLLAADLEVAAPATTRIEWSGRLVDVARDAWIVQASSATATTSDLNLPTAWRVRPLGEGLYGLSAPGASITGVLAWAGRTASVATVEPDFALGTTAIPADPGFDQLWGLRNVGQSGGTPGADIRAASAWNTTTGSRSVVVAVIDTGVDTTHPDLATNIWRNPREIPGDNRDNDGNGYVDDVHGWDFANGDADPMDDNGHGTHVAGTIGAVGGNGIGVAGVSWQVSIMPLKFMSGSGSGTTSSAIAAINYATMMRRDFGINVVATNNSWGGAANSLALRSAIAAGGNAGVLFVAAAGNSASDNDLAPSYPASFADPSVIAVAASDRMNALAGFSSFGATSVDVVAPGAGIYSTLPGGTYGWYSGTSMAAPHVTGTVALLAAAAPRASAGQIRAAILDAATPTATFAGKVATGGLLNAAGALERLGVPTPLPVQPAPPAPVPPTAPAPVSRPAPAPAPVPTPAPSPPRREIVDAGDTRATAMSVTAPTRIIARIGDGPAGSRDVDLYRVVLRAGQTLIVDVDARTLPGSSTLDSYLRLFDASGREFARNDDTRGSLDSYLSFRAALTGTYFIGVSGFPNVVYSSFLQARKGGATGAYELAIKVLSPAGAAPTGLNTLGHRDDAPHGHRRDLVALAIDAEARTTGARHSRRR